MIVTRGHRDDMRVLRWAVNANARYLGMIGSRRKTISIYKELEKEGIPAEKFANVHAPVGSGDRRGYAGRDCRGHRRRDDRSAPARHS